MKKISLPLNDDVLWDIIENGQTQPLVVDVASSVVNLGDNLLYYISNAELNVVFDWTNCTADKKSNIVLNYIQLNRLYENVDLSNTVFDLMMCYKGLLDQPRGIFTEDECVDFINNNVELFAKLIQFLDSVLILVCNGFKPIASMFKPNLYEQIEDNSISLNICYLLNIPEFVAYYSLLRFDNLKWYPIQFTKPIYNGKTLHDIVFESSSGLAAAVYAVMVEQGFVKEQ